MEGEETKRLVHTVPCHQEVPIAIMGEQMHTVERDIGCIFDKIRDINELLNNHINELKDQTLKNNRWIIGILITVILQLFGTIGAILILIISGHLKF